MSSGCVRRRRGFSSRCWAAAPAPSPRSARKGRRCRPASAGSSACCRCPCRRARSATTWPRTSACLGLLAATCGKIGREIYTLMKTEFGEVEEPVPPGTVGSSTMPQKRNPKLCQDIIAAAAEVRAMVPLALEAMQTEHEADRTTSLMMDTAEARACDRHRRHAGPAGRGACAGCGSIPRACARNLDLGGGLIMAEAVMLDLGAAIGRQHAHDVVYDAAPGGLRRRPAVRANCSPPTRGSPRISTARRSRRCSTRPPIPVCAPTWPATPRARARHRGRHCPRDRRNLGSRQRTPTAGHKLMEFGASIFFTDYSISPAELAVALEERGFDSLWAAEHSHIPVPRRTPAPGGGELAKRYYDVMDPFVTLTAAAAATKRLKARHRHLPGHPARHDPDREARRLDRPGLGRAVSVRHRRRLERRGDRKPRHGLRHPHAKDARADRGDEGDLDQVDSRNITARSSRSRR